MFWTRHSRDARRQKVLDELLDLDPGERRERLEAAVGVGDVHANEVDAALLMVNRLDALRVMTIPTSGVLSRTTLPVAPIGVPDDGEDADPVWAVRLPAQRPAEDAWVPTDDAAIPIVADAEPSWPRLDAAPLPIDAVETASRIVARDRVARRRRPTGPSPSQRRRNMAAVSPKLPAPLAMPLGYDTAAGISPEETWPTISWLRP